MRKPLLSLAIFVVVLSTLFPLVSAEGDGNSGFNPQDLLPIAVGLLVAGIMWKWFIPNQLSNLQVAFEIN